MTTREEIIKELQKKQDLNYRDFHSGLCPGTVNIIGVRIPEQRKIAHRVSKENWREFLEESQNEFYEETMVEGIIIATAKMDLSERLEWLKKFVPKINNWAVCDSVCASFKLKGQDRARVWNFITGYRQSSREFELRFMFIMMLDHFLDTEHITEVLEAVKTIRSEAYYVKMAQAWLIAEAFVEFRDVTLALLETRVLPVWVQNKAIQKIRESYRVSMDDKELVKKLKDCPRR